MVPRTDSTAVGRQIGFDPGQLLAIGDEIFGPAGGAEHHVAHRKPAAVRRDHFGNARCRASRRRIAIGAT